MGLMLDQPSSGQCIQGWGGKKNPCGFRNVALAIRPDLARVRAPSSLLRQKRRSPAGNSAHRSSAPPDSRPFLVLELFLQTTRLHATLHGLPEGASAPQAQRSAPSQLGPSTSEAHHTVSPFTDSSQQRPNNTPSVEVRPRREMRPSHTRHACKHVT